MVKEKPPIQVQGSNDCGPVVAYNMTLLGQGRLIDYDPNLLTTLRQSVQRVLMYGSLNPAK